MADAQPSVEEQIEQELSCSICLELFTRPKVLPCQHTFCQDCLQDLARDSRHFQCPNCRQQIKLPQPGVADFPSNTHVANLCDTLRKRTKGTDKEREHNQPKVKCSFHPSEDITLYCIQCQVPVCIECLGENHKGHPATNLKTAVEERKASTEMLLTEAREIMEKYNNVQQELTNKETNLNEQKQQRDDKIDEALEKAVQELRGKRDLLKIVNDHEHTEKITALQAQKNEVETNYAEISFAWFAGIVGLEKGGVDLLSTEATLLEVVRKYRRKLVPTPKSIQTVEFHPTDPNTLTLGQFSSQKKPSWLGTVARWIIRILLLLLQVLFFAVWSGLFVGVGLVCFIMLTDTDKIPIFEAVIIAILIVFSFSISLYGLLERGTLRFFSLSFSLFIICHVCWLYVFSFVIFGHGKHVEAAMVVQATVYSCFAIIGFICWWDNHKINDKYQHLYRWYNHPST